MIHSESFGRAFWLDEENEVCSAPWRKDGTVDTANMDYVSEWQDMEGVDIARLMDIVKRLIDDKMSRYSENITRLNRIMLNVQHAANITKEQVKAIKGNML